MRVKYSYIEPKTKDILFSDTKIWGSFFFISIIILLSFNYIVKFKSNSNHDTLIKNKEYVIEVNQKIQNLRNEIENLDYKKKLAYKIHSDNLILKDSIKNIFDLIPNKITLSHMELQNKKLIMKGETPSKNMYRFLLGIPLRSIFDISTTSFYLTPNNKFKFTSINKQK